MNISTSFIPLSLESFIISSQLLEDSVGFIQNPGISFYLPDLCPVLYAVPPSPQYSFSDLEIANLCIWQNIFLLVVWIARHLFPPLQHL
jgi:hypothetical protein